MHSNQQAQSNSFNYKHNQNTFNQQSSITNKSNQFHNQLTTHNRLYSYQKKIQTKVLNNLQTQSSKSIIKDNQHNSQT